MKKIILALIAVTLLVVGAITFSLFRKENIVKIEQEWVLSSSQIDTIELYGSQQPIHVILQKGNQPKTVVHLSGAVTSSAQKLVEQKTLYSENSLNIPLSKHGFHLTLSDKGKSLLIMTITLGQDVEFDKLIIDTLIGDILVTVPKDFEGKYDIKTNNVAKIVELPETTNQGSGVIEIDAYGDVRVIRED